MSKPTPGKRVANFAKALSRHVADGMVKVELSQYIERINTCNECPLLKDGVCQHEDCGCFVGRKAWWRSENCPDKKWPEL